ncbi:MAG: Unknown protein [uncultured Sulfurovum sp.]|uniref:Uncharacterized protein n=1 Tax=uncultured Sulfurovum sp. TaxID=269237 RepID=A0A6S6SE37_9BACT|nr:MAG: Unknown protein [uncultured Sulfurovum sp.]
MKKPITLLLTFSLAIFMINCSGKQKTPPAKVHTPRINIESNRPSLGQIISTPPMQNTVPPVPIEQISKTGKSHVSKKFKLPNTIKETSGLIKLDNRLWTFNDSGGKATLYQIDETNGQIVNTLNIQNAHNTDWEDIAYDDNYVYIGDIGNNRGNRKDLRVYKIPRTALGTQKNVLAEIIHFTYSDQKEFSSKPQKNNYDCEAMIAYNGNLYLFSKNWQNQKTRLYELSGHAGKHEAKYLSTFNIQGLVTGASINKELNILLLSTYSPLLNVNVWAFTNYKQGEFFNANSKKLNFTRPLQGQVEAITFTANYKAYLSTEAFKKYIFSFDATLYELDFSEEFE